MSEHRRKIYLTIHEAAQDSADSSEVVGLMMKE